ncbi:MAG: biotin/lipoyl-binding protein [Gemmatimonadaceae bacterium]|nr:biotin/lipoyl-binding protein [Gemmatimonadaceae bacterium]
MKYVVDVNGTRVDLTLAEGGVSVGETFVQAHLMDVEGTPVQLVQLAGEVHRVVVRRGEARGAYTLWIDGHRYQVDALDERTRTIRDLTADTTASGGPRPLVAPMPGLIVRVLVQAGDVVTAGQAVAVMEAMKMENELRSASGGTVRTILVQPGVAVEKGAHLIEFA